MSHDAQVLGHRMPLKRIDMDPVWEVAREPNHIELQIAEMRRTAERAQGERIWAIIRQVAEGTNPPCVHANASDVI